jgi:hypothetical protein
MCPCFRDAREPWEVFGGCRKRGVAWGSWTEIKIHHGRGQGGAAGRGGGAGRVPEGRKGQLQSVWSTNTLSLQRKILSFLRRLKSRVIIKGDPAARVCRIHLQGGLVVWSNSQGRCLCKGERQSPMSQTCVCKEILISGHTWQINEF